MSTNITLTQPAATRFPATMRLSWGAVIAGVVAALALNLLLVQVGIGLGLLEDGLHGSMVFGVGAASAWLASNCVAFFVGAWLAGRMADKSPRAATAREGARQGIVVWAAGSVAMLLLATAAGVPLAAGWFSTIDLNPTDEQQRGVPAATLAFARPDLDRALAEGWNALPIDQRLVGRARLQELLAQRFTTSEQSELAGSELAELTQLLATQIGMSPVAARKTLEQWDELWKHDRQESLRAREVIVGQKAQARRAARWSVIAMCASAIAAMAGGATGLTSGARHHEGLIIVPS